ncbi:MAG: aldose 1-epimerase family protein [Cytophagales bacterium]
MESKIANSFLTISAKIQGAELTSIKSNTTGIEYLWQALPSIWPRHAPVLFPIVGKLADGKYNYKGKTYELPQHGFARDMDFELVGENNNILTYILVSTPDTLAKFPFEFKFYVIYQLLDNQLITTYKVLNVGKDDMYFSVGAHPAYACPILPTEKFEDYYLEFEQKEVIGRYLIQNGLISQHTIPLLYNENILPLSVELFKDDAIVLKNIKSKTITIKSNKSAHSVKMNFDGFPFFGIWTKPGNNAFICLEPWLGIADTVDKKQDFTQKEGILKLEAGQSFEASYTVTFN